MNIRIRKNLLLASAMIISLFGLLTLFMSGSVLFDWFGIRQMEGNFVWFVVIVNFMCGGLYLLAAYGFLTERRWTTTLMAIATVILLLTFSGLLWYIGTGGIYEAQTVKAMVFRIFVTVLFSGIAWMLISRHKQQIV